MALVTTRAPNNVRWVISTCMGVWDVTVKQVTSNVTDMDKINIVSSQVVLEMSSFSVDTRSMFSSPLVNSLFKNRLLNRWAAVSIHPHYGFVCGRHDAAWQPRSRNPQDWNLGCLEATGWAQESLDYRWSGQIIYVCNSERIINFGQYLRKLCSNEKGSSVLTRKSQCF